MVLGVSSLSRLLVASALIIGLLVGSVVAKWVSRDRENVKSMNELRIGVSRKVLISKLGEPIKDTYSQDGQFEWLEFRTPPLHPVMLTAVLNVPLDLAVQLVADEDSVRTMQGQDARIRAAFKDRVN